MAIEVHKYHLPPTTLIPNSPLPLLHYPGFWLNHRPQPSSTSSSNDARGTAIPPTTPTPPTPGQVHDLYTSNKWQTQWIFRYGPTQPSHYHSRAHECMTVLTGSATIRFGVADTEPPSMGGDNDATKSGREHASGDEPREAGGVEVQANAGDVFILPAGTAHKTFNVTEGSTFKLLTPGDGHGIPVSAGDPVSTSNTTGSDAPSESEAALERAVLDGIELTGFTMMGSYPLKSGAWDFAIGGEDAGKFQEVWDVPVPERDPILGESVEGLRGLWKGLVEG